MLHEAVERHRQGHQLRPFRLPDLGNGSIAVLRMGQTCPQRPAPGLQPFVERRQRGKRGRAMPDPVARDLHAALHLALLPARGRIAELRLEQIVAHHRLEALVDQPRLAPADPVHGGLHVVVDTALRDPAEDPQAMVMRVEQHLVALQQIGPQPASNNIH